MKLLKNLNTFVIAIVLAIVYGIAFGVAKILMLVTAPTPQSSAESYWIPEKQKINNDYQSPY